MSTIERTPLASLIQWKGHPVPWVTRWTGEIPDQETGRLLVSAHRKTGELRASYPDGNEDREPNGILWQREGINRGGEPQFSQVSTYRQRLAMRKQRCQVCGSTLPKDQPIRWLMGKTQLEYSPTGQAITMSPPTCSGCIPVALDVCPHLRTMGYQIARVLEYRIWGVSAELIRWNPTTGQRQRMKNVLIEYAVPTPGIDLPAVIAKQQVVQLTKYAMEEV